MNGEWRAVSDSQLNYSRRFSIHYPLSPIQSFTTRNYERSLEIGPILPEKMGPI